MKIIPAGVEKTRGMAGGKWGDVYIVRRHPEYDYNEEMANAANSYNNLANLRDHPMISLLQSQLAGPASAYCPCCGSPLYAIVNAQYHLG